MLRLANLAPVELSVLRGTGCWAWSRASRQTTRWHAVIPLWKRPPISPPGSGGRVRENAKCGAGQLTVETKTGEIYRGTGDTCFLWCFSKYHSQSYTTEEFRIEEGRESGSLRTIMLPLDNIWLLATGNWWTTITHHSLARDLSPNKGKKFLSSLSTMIVTVEFVHKKGKNGGPADQDVIPLGTLEPWRYSDITLTNKLKEGHVKSKSHRKWEEFSVLWWSVASIRERVCNYTAW